MSRRPRVPGTTSRPRVLFVLPTIPDELDEQTKNALALRNLCATEGRCPDCHADGELTGPDEHGVFHLVFRHESDCGVLDDGEVA